MEHIDEKIENLNARFNELLKIYEDNEEYEKCQTLMLYREIMIPGITYKIEQESKPGK